MATVDLRVGFYEKMEFKCRNITIFLIHNQRYQLGYPTSEEEENGISERRVSDALDV